MNINKLDILFSKKDLSIEFNKGFKDRFNIWV